MVELGPRDSGSINFMRKIMVLSKKVTLLFNLLFTSLISHSIKQPPEGISIVVPTIRQHFMERVFENYSKQTYPKKELIVVLNDDSMDINLWEEKAKEYEKVRIYQIAQENNKSQSLNFGFEKAKYNYFAVMDDDDYYSKTFLSRSVESLEKTGADVAGKETFFVFFEGANFLGVTKVSITEPCAELDYINEMVTGGTMIFKRHVFESIKFDPEVIVHQDKQYCQDSIKKGFKVYSFDRYDYCYLRRTDNTTHIWDCTNDEFASRCEIVAKNVQDYRMYVDSEFSA